MNKTSRKELIICFLTLIYVIPFTFLITINLFTSFFQTTYMDHTKISKNHYINQMLLTYCFV